MYQSKLDRLFKTQVTFKSKLNLDKPAETQEEVVIAKERTLFGGNLQEVDNKLDNSKSIHLKNETVQIANSQEHLRQQESGVICVGCRKIFQQKIHMLLHQKRNHECPAYNPLTELSETQNSNMSN